MATVENGASNSSIISSSSPSPTSSLPPLLPPKPEEPLDSECCGTGCTPCVFDIYKTKLKRWEEDCVKIRNGEGIQTGESSSSNAIISPYEYGNYIVREITEDCLNCKILTFQKHNEVESSSPSSDFTVTDTNFPVKLGQHVVLKIDEKCRQYTILDFKKDGSFRIVFKIYGKGILTPLVDKLVLQSIVEMRGPFGTEFAFKPNQYDCLLMFAAGTGIAPFCRIIQRILGNDDQDETRILLCYACQNEDQVILREKLKEWSRSWNFQVKYFLSSVKDSVKAKSIHYGMPVNFKRIDKSVIEELCKVYDAKKKNILYMICGTNSFEKDIVKNLKLVGVEEDKIKTF